jgi:hypothetical protein
MVTNFFIKSDQFNVVEILTIINYAETMIVDVL